MKTKALVLAVLMIVSTALFAGCSNVTPAATTVATTTVDASAGASHATDAATFEKAVSAQGTWIIYTTADLTVTKALTLDGEFTNGKKDDAGKDIVQRKIALYTQDADRKVTARFTLTIPELTIKSPKASIQHGIVKGDLIVDVDGFQLVDTKVEGNVYFTKQAYKDSFVMDADSSITGKNEVKAN
ncbi:MAG: hypothetical protein KBA30_11490 [Clostridia bacterium]|nr:hypothetical protein [Clostridia bacterium]